MDIYIFYDISDSFMQHLFAFKLEKIENISSVCLKMQTYLVLVISRLLLGLSHGTKKHSLRHFLNNSTRSYEL